MIKGDEYTMEQKMQYGGMISDLPVVTGGHFIENSEKRIVYGPDGRFWDDFVMRCFTLAPRRRLRLPRPPLVPLDRVHRGGRLLQRGGRDL